MKIIIVGCGKVGATLAEQLSKEGHNITIVDTNKEVVQSLSNALDIMGVIGNGASYAVQVEAGIEEADLLIAVTNSDELNLLCCVIGKKDGTYHTIARVRNPVYSNEIGSIRSHLGLNMVINPELAAAAEIARVLYLPSAIKIEPFAKGRVELLKFKIRPGSRLHNYSLMDITSRLKCDVLICIVERGDEVTIPNGSFVLQEGDVVSFVASPKNAADFFRKIGVATTCVKNTMLVGGGDISYYLSKQLLSRGISVKIIEKNKERCNMLSDLLPKAIIINGDGSDQSVLMEEGLPHIESFAALTNMDEENILLSLFAKSQSEAKVVTKVNRITFDEIINTLDLGSIIYPKYITAEHIIRYVRGMQNSIGSNIETLYKLIGDKVEALEFLIHEDSPVIGVPIQKLPLRNNILIACIHHRGRIIIPGGQNTISVGDTVVIVTTNTGLDDIQDILIS